ncbi:MAG: carbon starvation protein A [Chthoniobacterales bacterium]
MQVLLISVCIFVLYLVAYHTYGRWLGRRIFELSAKRICPSHELHDGADYVPTHFSVVFGHHFTSIAGTGPIVGPAIGVIWGWVPALLWVFFGSIFIGAVHDLGSLVLSLRNQGKSIGELAGMLVGPRVRLLFMLILLLTLTLVLAVFGLVIAVVFTQFPKAIFPCLLQIPLATVIGIRLHRRNQGLLPASLLSLGIMYLAIFFGDVSFLHDFNLKLASMPVWLWTTILLGYCYLASVLPVWLLLQPRDFINSLQLLSVVALLLLGLFVTAFFGGTPLTGGERPALEIVAPAFNMNPEGAPAIFPFLFITIACGAVSGFHCLVSSGTSSKQLHSEKDARFVGFGAMLTEGFLAVIVIFACAAGLGLGLTLPNGEILQGHAAWAQQYENWGQAQSLKATVGAFVTGAGNFLSSLGIPKSVGIALMGVFVASFAATTMDSACRLQRYVVQEFAGSFSSRPGHENIFVRFLKNRHGSTLLCVIAAGIIAAIPPVGQEWSLKNAGNGGLLLWPLFGAMNQLVAGIAFIVVTFYVRSNGKPFHFLILPTLFMLVMPAWAMGLQVFWGTSNSPSWLEAENWPLVFIGASAILLEVWLVIEAALLWKKHPAGGMGAD